MQLNTQLATLEARLAHLRECFPEVAADPHPGTIPGGRAAAEARLATLEPVRYASSRNFLDGAVTRLSPYLRHGVLSLAEVRDAALQRVSLPEQAGKFINELGWRDFFQRAYDRLGSKILHDREPIKTGHPLKMYQAELPADIAEGRTGMHCIDGFVRELRETGYLHNHARMWFASYVVHHRKIRWQAGAKFFLEHLIDGDVASNHLSWQWVASTFAAKPYFFNRENLEKFTAGSYCNGCPLRGHCDFEGSYEDIEARLFRPTNQQPSPDPLLKKYPAEGEQKWDSREVTDPILWFHNEHLNPVGELRRQYPDAPAIYVFDEAWLKEERPSLKRLRFILDCLSEMQITALRGHSAAAVTAFAKAHHRREIATVRSPSHHWKSAAEALQRTHAVQYVPLRPFLARETPFDLSRFSKYWNKAEPWAYEAAKGR